jgi:hypothetical protein
VVGTIQGVVSPAVAIPPLLSADDAFAAVLLNLQVCPYLERSDRF